MHFYLFFYVTIRNINTKAIKLKDLYELFDS